LSDVRKKEIYQYIQFFHGALQLIRRQEETEVKDSEIDELGIKGFVTQFVLALTDRDR